MEGYIVKTIPKFTWAVFPCYGPGPESIQETNRKYFQSGYQTVEIMKLLQVII